MIVFYFERCYNLDNLYFTDECSSICAVSVSQTLFFINLSILDFINLPVLFNDL